MAEKLLSQAVRERRATPHFQPEPIPEADLKKIVEAGLEAPSGQNVQPWRFVVVRSPEQRERLKLAAMNQAKVGEAPVVIVACGDPDAWKNEADEVFRMGNERGIGLPADNEKRKQGMESYFGAAPGEAGGNAPDWSLWLNRHVMIAFTTMMWMAEALGYDTAPMEGFYEGKVRETLGIPDRVRVIALLAIGHLKGADKAYAGRVPLERLAFDDSWGKGLKLADGAVETLQAK